MRTVCCFVLSLLVSLTAFADEPVRILSFNVRLSLANDGENSWANRKEFLTDIIAGGSYDFVGTQETVIDPRPDYNQVTYITSKMTGYGNIYLSREKTTDKGEAMMIMWKQDRWKIDDTDKGTFWLSDTPEVAGSKTDPEAGCPRTVTFGLFHELKDGKATGKKIYVYDTHYDHLSNNARMNGAKLLMERVSKRKDLSTPVVVMGDLNCGEKSNPIQYMQGKTIKLDGTDVTAPLKLIDTFRAANPDATDVGSFNSWKKIGTEKIDYIFVTEPLKTVSSKLIKDQRDGRFPSDHLPLEAVIELSFDGK